MGIKMTLLNLDQLIIVVIRLRLTILLAPRKCFLANVLCKVQRSN